jgi:hypothetical protein
MTHSSLLLHGFFETSYPVDVPGPRALGCSRSDKCIGQMPTEFPFPVALHLGNWGCECELAQACQHLSAGTKRRWAREDSADA